MAAQEWAQLVDEEEPELAPVIRSCSYSFPVKADWSDKRFVQAAYASIVEPRRISSINGQREMD
jgi:hypothetical protein